MKLDLLRKMLAVLAVAMLGLPLLAATKTVDAAGGGDYTTLAAAVTDMNNDAWGAEPHTILVTDNQINPINARITFLRSVTVTNAPGDSPKFLVDQTNLGNAHILYIANDHTYLFENLTFFGTAGSQPSDSDNVLFRVDNGTGNNLNFTLRNCLITANNGSDQPVTDYTLDPTSVRGYFFHPVLPFRSDPGPEFVTIDNCTFAYTTRGVAVYGPVIPATGSVTITNTLFVQKNDNSLLLLPRNYNNIPFVINKCAFIHTNMVADTDSNIFALLGTNTNLTVTDSIFASRYHTAIRCEDFNGSTLNLNRVTAYVGRQIIFAPTLTGSQTFNLRDIVGYLYPPRQSAGMLYFSGTPTLNFNNLAIFEGRWDATDGASPNANLVAAIGGLSPALLGDDPMFTTTTFGAGQIGQVGWDSGLNTLYDVNNTAFVGKGTAGAKPNDALTGGADGGPLVPAELSNFASE